MKEFLIDNIKPMICTMCVMIVLILTYACFMSYADEQMNTHGIVVDKYYEPSYTQIVPMTINGNTTPIPITYPESYALLIKDEDGKIHNINVKPEVYVDANIGDMY